MRYRGFLISVEGLDGSGKTTLCYRLENLIRKMLGRKVVQCSAISDHTTTVGRRIGDIVKDRNAPIAADAEFLLMTAARIQCWEQIMLPALIRGDIVISDRHTTSMFAYQRDAHGNFLPQEYIKRHLALWGIDVQADINILLDVDPETPLEDFDVENRLETRPMDEWKKMRDIFRDLTAEQPNNITIDVNVNDEDRVLAVAFDHICHSIEEGL